MKNAIRTAGANGVLRFLIAWFSGRRLGFAEQVQRIAAAQ